MVRSRAVTSYDVAKRAGVSRSIVSGVLNGAMSTMRVSDETRQRVLTAATDLGYSPNPLARALRRQRSNVIGFVPRSSRRSPYEHPVPFLLGLHIARAAMRRGYHVVEASAETASSRESEELTRFLLDRRIDGVILDSPETIVEVQRFVDHGIPVVQVIRPQTAVATPSIVVDAGPGIAAGIDHLVESGHRRIAYIGHGGLHPVDHDRFTCFTAMVARHGIDVPPEWLHLVPDYGIAEGYTAGRALFVHPERPTALFVAGDNLALGVLQALYEVHVRVPDALSLVSYDDIFATHLAPPLTSVTQPIEEVAERAMTFITGHLDGDHSPVAPEPAVALPSRLTVRASTGRPRVGTDSP